VLEIRWIIYAKELRWTACRDIAVTITKLDPSRMSGWIHLAYATRRSEPEQTGLINAQSILLSAIERFPKESIVP
jgi:hypothetical protein